jgi:hypothetical protein
MKFSLKFALVLCLVSLCSTFSFALAQTSSITSVVSPTTVNLNSVYLVNNATNTNNDLTALDAWAVGDSGTIIHWNGNSWSSVNSPTAVNLYSVFFVNASSGWAVGGSSNNGVILHYNGSWSVWNKISFSGNASGTDTINATLYSVTTNGTGMVGWAVGANGTSLDWNGATWFGMTNVSSNTLRSVDMIPNSNDAWAVGDNGTILHWNATAWTNMTSPTTANLYTIHMINDTNAWAGGGNSSSGVLINLNGTTWNVWNKINFGGQVNSTAGYITDSINATINSMSFDNATSAWAVGGKGTVLYWTGTEWDGQTNVSSDVNLRGVSMVHGTSNGSTQAWAVGDTGRILAWTGTKWIPEIPIIIVAPLLLSIGLTIALFLRKSRLSKKIFSIK